MHECNKCSEFGFKFERNYLPVEFIEGKANSKVWIIGLNPAMESGWKDEERTSKELEELVIKKNEPYFRNFKPVSETIYNNFGKDFGTAHTDIVKCSSLSFPPEGAKGKKTQIVINNCSGFLKTQIQTNKPKIIVCNGADVSNFMIEFLPPPEGFSRNETSYWSNIDDTKVCVILSGFIGRIDNYARRRLGKEIEERLLETS
jgi:hypothetical protein